MKRNIHDLNREQHLVLVFERAKHTKKAECAQNGESEENRLECQTD